MEWILPLQILHITSLFIYIQLIIFISTNYLFENRNKLLVILTSNLALWSFCKIFLHNPATPLWLAIFFDKLSSISWIFIPPFFLILSFFIINKNLNSFKISLILLPGFIFLIYNIFSNFHTVIKTDYGWFSTFTKSLSTYIFAAYYIGYIAFSLFLLKKYCPNNVLSKKQINLVFYYTLIILCIIILLKLVFIFFDFKDNPLTDILNFYFLIWTIGIIYANIKYHFLGFSPTQTFKIILSELNEYIFILDEEFNITYINQSALKSLGYNESEIINQPLGKIINENQIFNKMVKDLLKNKLITGYDINLKTKNGFIIFTNFSANAITEKEKFIRFVCVATDITERIKLHNEITKNLEITQKYLNFAPVIFLILDNNGKIVFINKYGKKIIGIENDAEIIGKNFFDNFILDEEKENLKNYFNKLLEEPETKTENENYLIAKSGEKLIIHWSNIVLKDENNKIYGILSAGIDITEKKQSEIALKESYKKLLELDKLKNNFISIVSHELRTPLTSIIGFISLMRGGAAGKLSKDQYEYIEIMKNNAERLLKIINDLLDMSKIESGRFTINFSEADIVYVINKSVNELKSLFEKKHITVSFETDVKNLTIKIDAERFMQAIINLLNNAIKFSQANSKIIIGLKLYDIEKDEIKSEIKEKLEQKKYILLWVKDSGIGMTEKQIKNLFTKFYQAEDANTRKTPGTGLGLYITKYIIESHNGFIWAYSEGLNKGSTFYILIPVE